MTKGRLLIVLGGTLLCVLFFMVLIARFGAITISGVTRTTTSTAPLAPAIPPLDRAAYDAKLLEIANLAPTTHIATTSFASGTLEFATTTPSVGHGLWPAKTVYPDGGALLPFNRIVAYYGNLYSTQMGILGEYPAPQMLQMLASTTAAWAAADPTTPVIPALDYIVVAAQAGAGPDGKYRLRMPDDQVDRILAMAKQVNGIVILDVQVGLSNVQIEIPLLEKYLKLPQVHLAIDPEFAMHNGAQPGTVIGSLDATDINFVATYLAHLVKEYDLPPKILIVHRFTEPMVTNYKNIMPLSEVQIVMDMDGFGPPAQKLTTYKDFIYGEPVQFTGFKLFYKNDVRVGGHLMTPSEVLKLSPEPSFIQYQ